MADTTPEQRKERAMLDYAAQASTNRVAPAGSPYLYALACAYLASPEASDEEATLERMFLDRADVEDVDGDDLLTALCLVDGGEAEASRPTLTLVPSEPDTSDEVALWRAD